MVILYLLLTRILNKSGNRVGETPPSVSYSPLNDQLKGQLSIGYTQIQKSKPVPK